MKPTPHPGIESILDALGEFPRITVLAGNARRLMGRIVGLNRTRGIVTLKQDNGSLAYIPCPMQARARVADAAVILETPEPLSFLLPPPESHPHAWRSLWLALAPVLRGSGRLA